MLLAACAGPIETRVDVRQSAAPIVSNSSYAFVPLADDDRPSPIDAAIRQIISARLTGMTIEPFETATIVLAYGLSERPANMTIAGLSPAERKHRFQNCGRIVRLTISLSSRESGKLLYSGSAEEYHCKASPEEVLPHLAAAILPDGTWPTASITLKRKGKK